MDLDVAVVGAGVAGLAVAHRVRAAGRRAHVFESADHVGGRTRTARLGGWLVDTGAEVFGDRGHPATRRLMAEVGLTDDDAPPVQAGLAAWREGRAHPGFGDPRSAGLGIPARLALARLRLGARLRPGRYDPEHPEATPLGLATVTDLVRRKPPELREHVFAALASGPLGWDPALACAGPLLAHLASVGGGARVFRDGMDTLARALAERVAVSTGMAVTEVAETRSGARLRIGEADITARQVVLAVPAPVAAALHPDAPAYVRAVAFRPMVAVACLLETPVLAPGGGYGLLFPPAENPVLAAVCFGDRKHPYRVPRGRGLVTLLAGQAVAGELVDAPAEHAADVLLAEARRYLPGLRIRRTVVSAFRHGQPMPTPAALAARGEFARRAPSAVEYAGDWYALRPCVEGAARSAELVAERIGAAVPAAVGP
ncbi:FAD-dependent oxidoreductase [Actinokineospora guangxiensis]|uniref:FAD-dependent oxidoreductase n=1 Tax=Actinokineospora guangxiensis TaxID=1490288 RepID=A0ABW0EVV3_9PSEU